MFPMNHLASTCRVAPHLAYVMEPFAFFHDVDMIAGFPPIRRILLSLLASSYRHLDVRGVRDADAVMTINDGTVAWVRTVYDRESTTSLLGVDSTMFAPRDDATMGALRARYAGRRLVIHSTDFTPLKRTGAAIDAIASIRRDVPTVTLLVTSSVEDAAALAALRRRVTERGLTDHVEFLGHLAHETLPYYYALADVSLYTGIGRGASAASLFVLECMACGTPGVRTRFTEEEVEHGVSGFLFDPDDTEGLRRHLTRVLTDDGLRAAFSRAARARILGRFTWAAVADRLVHGIATVESSKRPIPEGQQSDEVQRRNAN
jgi:glycosyltransferase involved in cell wall biosynthesis